MILLALVPAILLFGAAVGHWQYGLAPEFRWTVGGLTFLLTLAALQRQSAGWLLVLGLIAILYNPVVPIRVSRDTLELLDLLASALVLTAGIDFAE